MNLYLEQHGYVKIAIKSCFFSSFFYFIWFLTMMILPVEVLSMQLNHALFRYVENNMLVLIINFLSISISSVLMMSVITCFYHLAREKNKAIMSIASIFGIAGFLCFIFGNIQNFFFIYRLIPIFDNVSLEINTLISIFGSSQLDYGIVSFGCTGFWFVTVSLLALNNKQIPKHLVILSLFVGVLSFLLIFLSFFSSNVFTAWFFSLYIFLIIIWTGLEGFFLLQFSKKLK